MVTNSAGSGGMQDDWRIQLTARLTKEWKSPWTGEVSPEGTRITLSAVVALTKKKQVTIPVPNATALLLNSAARSFTAAKTIRDRSGIDNSLQKQVTLGTDEEVFDYIEYVIESIILAFSALEAFVNETIPDEYVYSRHVKSDVILEAASKATIERHVNLDEKLTVVLPDVLGCQSPKGSRCWQGYRQLKNVRDRLVHMKSDDRKSSGPEAETIWKEIFLMPAPHMLAKAIIDHFAKTMQSKPAWYLSYPHAKA